MWLYFDKPKQRELVAHRYLIAKCLLARHARHIYAPLRAAHKHARALLTAGSRLLFGSCSLPALESAAGVESGPTDGIKGACSGVGRSDGGSIRQTNPATRGGI